MSCRERVDPGCSGRREGLARLSVALGVITRPKLCPGMEGIQLHQPWLSKPRPRAGHPDPLLSLEVLRVPWVLYSSQKATPTMPAGDPSSHFEAAPSIQLSHSSH